MRDLCATVKTLVDGRTGIVKSIDYIEPIRGGPGIHVYRGSLATPSTYINGKVIQDNVGRLTVSGCDTDAKLALWSTIGEAIERYAAYTFDDRRTITADYNSLQARAVHPDKWVNLESNSAASERHYCRYEDDAQIRWTWATHYLTGERRLVPAVAVWLRLGKTHYGENFIQRASTGLGAGSSVEQAQLSGILEVVERDAFASRWLLSACPRRIVGPVDLNQLLPPNQGESGITAELFDIAVSPGPAVILARLRLPNRDFGFCLGASASFSYEEARKKSLTEAYHILQGMLHWRMTTGGSIEMKDVRDFVDHGRYYSQSQCAESVEWFFEQGERFEDSCASICAYAKGLPGEHFDARSVAEQLYRLGYDSYFVDITPSDMQELGFSVIKTIVPGMQPLGCGATPVQQDLLRLRRLGHVNRYNAAFAVNPQLQPFA